MKTLLYFLMIMGGLYPSSAFTQHLEISLPLNRAVYQRSVTNDAIIPVRFQVFNTSTKVATVTFNKLDPKTGTSPLPYHTVTLSTPTYGLFNTDVTLHAGWYEMKVSLYDFNNQLIVSKTQKVGVGEVFYGAGQSNMQGIELGTAGPPILLGEAYDAIQVINQNCFCKQIFPFPILSKMERGFTDGDKKIAPNGNQNIWMFEVLGREIVDLTNGVPVLFFNAASTGTLVSNWSETADDESKITSSPWTINCNPEIEQWGSDGAEGQPYKGLRTSLNYYGGMFGARAVLWHQGESDNFLKTTTSTYFNALKKVIERSRQHFDNRLGWAISLVSHFPPNQNNTAITQAQRQVKNAITNTTWGAFYSDSIKGDGIYRKDSDLHFNSEGLKKLGVQFTRGTVNNLPVPTDFKAPWTLTPVPALQVPTIAVSTSGGVHHLSVPNDYKSYCWVANNGSLNECAFTTPTISVTHGTWRCYVTQDDPDATIGHDKRNIVLTGNVSVPTANFQPALEIKSDLQLVP